MTVSFAGGTDTVAYGGSGWGSPGCIAFRIKTTQATANVSVASIWSSGSRRGLGMILNNSAGKITALAYDAAAPEKFNIVTTTSVNNGSWHHVALNWNTANGAANTIYVNGAQEATANNTAAWSFLNSGNSPLAFSQTLGFWAAYIGEIAEVGIWNGRNLLLDEIAGLSKGFAPSLLRPSFYMPFLRDCRNLTDPFITGPTGTTVAAHPRMMGGLV